jgi:hypothetical protein
LTATLSDCTALAETLNITEVSWFAILWFNSRRSNDPSDFGSSTMYFVISVSSDFPGQKSQAER